MAAIVALAAQALLLLVLAPLAQGLFAWAAARLAGSAPTPTLQEYHDLWRWLRRAAGNERAANLALGATLTAGLLTPTVVLQAPLDGYGDLIVLAALLMAADLALPLMNVRAAWPSMSGPILLLALLALTAERGAASASALARAGGIGKHPAELPLFLALGCLVLVERRRLAPVHAVVAVGAFGLGMVDEAAITGGPARLALLVRQMVLLSLLANLFVPWGLGDADHDSFLRLLGGGALFLFRLTALGCLLACIETVLPWGRGERAVWLRLALFLSVLGLLAGGIAHA